jgi:hypothetical protein
MLSIARPRFASLAFLIAVTLAPALHPTPALAQDTTVHQVYEAVQAGRLQEAETLMDRVLREHPNSAKAHYVAAEVFAKEGKLDAARSELSKAEQIDPLLSFAKPESIRALRAAVRAGHNEVARSIAPRDAVQPTTERSGFPWLGLLLIVAAVVGVMAWIGARRRTASANAASMPPSPGGVPMASPYGAGPYPANPAPAPGGMGSGLVGALATGAAVGAGVVAGEALAHRLMGDHGHADSAAGNLASGRATPFDDATAGGPQETQPDFGVQDDGAWDDTGLSGGLGADVGGDDWT